MLRYYIAEINDCSCLNDSYSYYNEGKIYNLFIVDDRSNNRVSWVNFSTVTAISVNESLDDVINNSYVYSNVKELDFLAFDTIIDEMRDKIEIISELRK